MTQSNDFDFHTDWKLAIGGFIVTFSECEQWTSAYIAELLPREVANVANQLMLEQRSKIARAVLRETDLGIPRERIDDIFSRLSELGVFRNLVAHNPPMVRIYETDAGEEFRAVTELISRRNPSKQATLEEIKAKIREAEALSFDMLGIQRAILLKGLD